VTYFRKGKLSRLEDRNCESGGDGASTQFAGANGGPGHAVQIFLPLRETRAAPSTYTKRGRQAAAAAAAASERESMHYVWRDRFSAVETAAQRDDGERVRSSLSLSQLHRTFRTPRFSSAVSRSQLSLLGTLLQPTLLPGAAAAAGPFSFWLARFSASPKTPEILPWLLTLDCCRGFWLMRTLTHGHAFRRKGEE
jgi:hypothetical protein